MSEKLRFMKNIGYSLLGQFFQQLLMVAFFIIVTRYLNKTELGIYSYAVSTVGLFIAVMDLGISTMAVREIARDPSLSRTLMPQVVGIKTTVGFILTLAICAASYFICPTPEAGSVLRLMSVVLFLSPILAPYIIVFNATERLDLWAIVQVVSRLSMLVALIAVIFLGYRVHGVIATQIFGIICVIAVVVYLTTRYYHPVGIGFNLGEWKSIMARAVPFAAMTLLWEIYYKIDQILIPYLDSLEGNGLYCIAFKYAFIFAGVPLAINAVVYPYFSRRSMESDAPVISGMRDIYRYIGIIGLGITVFSAVPATEWVVLLSGIQYAEAGSALFILSFCIPFMFYNSINISALYSYNRQYDVLRYSVVSISLNLLLDFILIPKMGYTGAAWATLASSCTIFSLTFIRCAKFVGARPLIGSFFGPAASAALAWTTLTLTSDYHLFLRIPAAAIVFIAALVITKSIRREDFDVIAEKLRGAKKQ
ncbi:flippase [bacterium]